MFIVINLKYFDITFSDNSRRNIAKMNVVPVPVLVQIKSSHFDFTSKQQNCWWNIIILIKISNLYIFLDNFCIFVAPKIYATENYLPNWFHGHWKFQFVPEKSTPNPLSREKQKRIERIYNKKRIYKGCSLAKQFIHCKKKKNHKISCNLFQLFEFENC